MRWGGRGGSPSLSPPPPAQEFASRCVKSLALVLTRHQQTFCSMAAHFRQMLPADCEIPSPFFRAVVTDFLLDGGSLPPDFARGQCQTNYNANKERIC